MNYTTEEYREIIYKLRDILRDLGLGENEVAHSKFVQFIVKHEDIEKFYQEQRDIKSVDISNIVDIKNILRMPRRD